MPVRSVDVFGGQGGDMVKIFHISKIIQISLKIKKERTKLGVCCFKTKGYKNRTYHKRIIANCIFLELLKQFDFIEVQEEKGVEKI